jgi:hypothetical protein
MDKKEFAKNFSPRATPVELAKLFAFQENADGNYFSDGFELTADDKGGLSSWSEDKEFLAALMPFAQANGSGSFYALWDDGSKSTSQMPVVIFGDEGGVHVVAENARGLLQLLCFDAEPMVDTDEVTFYKDEDEHEDSEAHDDYVDWLHGEFELEAADPKEVMDAAEEKHKDAFSSWFARFHKD